MRCTRVRCLCARYMLVCEVHACICKMHSCGVRNKRFATPGTAILRLAAARLARRIMGRWAAAVAIQIY